MKIQIPGLLPTLNLLVLAAVFLETGAHAWAATWPVTTAPDNNIPGSGNLRDIINNVASDGDTISIPSAFNPITITVGDIIVNKSLAIAGPGPMNLTIIGASPHARVFTLQSRIVNNQTVFPSVTISNLTFTGGFRGADGDPGKQNTPTGKPGDPAEGGIIFSGSGCSLTLSNCVMTNCYAIGGKGGDGFGGIIAAPGNGGDGGLGQGGAVFSDSRFVVTRCTFEYCVAQGGDGGAGTNALSSFPSSNGGRGGPAYGGAIYVGYDGVAPGIGAANCTLAANFAIGGNGGNGGGAGVSFLPGGNGGDGGLAEGGGVFHACLDANCAFPDCGYLIHCTVAQNHINPGIGGAAGGGNPSGTPGNLGFAAGGGLCLTPHHVQLEDTIVAANVCTVTTFAGLDVTDPAGAGAVLSFGYNLIGVQDACTGWLANDLRGSFAAGALDPLLGPLQNNGGQTPTMAPLQGSPAIDEGTTAGSGRDQAGQTRPRIVEGMFNGGDGSDIGAYELQCTPGNPSLTISQVGNQVVLSWPWPSRCFGLQQTTNLLPANWVDSPFVVNQVGNNNQVAIALPNGGLFFRLLRP